MLPAVLDQTMLATGAARDRARSRPRSPTSRGSSRAYVVAAAAATPLWGKLGDRSGASGCSSRADLFVAASALCGAAQDITQLIALRLVQGTAAGGLMTLAMAAVGDLVAPRERGRYQGYIAATFAVATIVGPLLGGVLVDGASWRWVFFVNLPVGLARPRRAARCGCRRPRPSRPGTRSTRRRRAARRRDERADAGVHLGRRPLRVGLGAVLALIAATVVLVGGARRARAARRRSDRAARAAAHARGRGRERRAVPRPPPRCSR